MSNKISFISGNFNVIHNGHIRLFKFAKSISDKLIIGLYCDKLASESVYINQNLRLEALREINLIDKIVIIKKNLKSTLIQINPDLIVKGLEFQNEDNEELEIIKGTKCQLVFSSGEVDLSLEINKNNLKNNNKIVLNDYFNRHNINKTQINSVINKFKNLKVLVIGDLIIDEFIECNPIGMSKETNSIVYSFYKQNKYLGGAGIVAAHASALGCKVHLLSSCGKDENGSFINEKLKKYHVKSEIIKTGMINTVKKTRFYNDNHSVFRLNYLNNKLLSRNLSDKIFNKFEKLSNNIDLVIFSDFNYGCLDKNLTKRISDICLKKNIMISADSQTSSQYGDISQYQNCDLITPTELEARSSLNDSQSGLIILLEKLRKQTKAKNIILTQGKDGLIIHHFDNKNYYNDALSSLNLNPLNTSGAGDALLVGASCALKISGDIWLSAFIGNLMSAIQISREGNTPIQFNELSDKIRNI